MVLLFICVGIQNASAAQPVSPVEEPAELPLSWFPPLLASETPDVPELTVPKEMVAAKAGMIAPAAAIDERAARIPKVCSLFIFVIV